MKTELLNKISRSAHEVGFTIQKHSPQILITIGVVGSVVSTVLACKSTLKLNDVLDESKDTINKIHETKETKPEVYSDQDARQDLFLTYFQTGVKLTKLYAPSILLGTVSLGCMVKSNNILSKRNIALAAAYTTVDKSFKGYRGRVIERFGEKVDQELKHNIKVQEIEKTVVDEDGNEKKVIESVNVVNPCDISEYARFFEEYTKDKNGNVVKNTYWSKNPEDNLLFIKNVERYANEKLRTNKRLFLNDVYEALGLPITKAGQVVGWVYDEECPNGDNCVDFGLYKDNLSYSDFVNGFENAILLDFNVDGNIWDLM